MRALVSRVLTPLTLVAYLLAMVCGTSPHEHKHALLNEPIAAAEEQGCGESHCRADHHHGHSHSHSHQHCGPHVHTSSDGLTSHCSGHGGPGHHDDENCLVCKFLSAKPLATPQVAIVEFVAAVADVIVPAVIEPEALSLGRPLSRGPPQLG